MNQEVIQMKFFFSQVEIMKFSLFLFDATLDFYTFHNVSALFSFIWVTSQI